MPQLLLSILTLSALACNARVFIPPVFDNEQVQPGCYNPPEIPQNLTARPQRWRGTSSLSPLVMRQVGKSRVHGSSGDSYTSTSFNINGPQPSIENPLGNPAYPGATSANGPNYVDFLTTTYNQSFIRTFNLGYGGATIDPSLVGSPYGLIVQSFRQQVQEEFVPTYATNSGVEWTGSNSLFTVFFGINDVILSYGQRNSTLNFLLIKSYENYVQKLYAAGARNFLFMNVPPIDRSPGTLARDAATQARMAGYIGEFNFRLILLVYNFAVHYPDTTVWLFDTNWLFTRLLNNGPGSFQETSGYVNVTDYCTAYQQIGQAIVAVKTTLWTFSFFINFEAATWDNKLVGGLDFVSNYVLQVPFLLMSLTRYITPTLDQMFMDSLQWVDQTYIQKHKSEDPNSLRAMYYPNLRMYSTHGDTSKQKAPMDAAILFLSRFGRRAATSLVIYALSYIPYVGRFVLPAASFYTFNNAVGPIPATIIFGSGIFLPRKYLVIFLQSYFSSRSLMRELLEPYFSRIRFNKEQKRLWFRDREGLLFGFGVGFYVFLKIPLLGVLIYGIAEASTAFLITKITDPPPPPAYSEKYAESQVRWSNKRDFLRLPLANLDGHNTHTDKKLQSPFTTGDLPGKKFS
ncbi:MAG: hypothetical protein Q9210_003231 [Variospora velana]